MKTPTIISTNNLIGGGVVVGVRARDESRALCGDRCYILAVVCVVHFLLLSIVCCDPYYQH
jgi:hypothetical protein